MSAMSRKRVAHSQDLDAVPDLSAGALQNLTQTIQDKLKKSNETPLRSNTSKAQGNKAPNNLKTKDKAAGKDLRSKSTVKEPRITKPQYTKPTLPRKPEQSQVKKRLRNGELKVSKTGHVEGIKAERSSANTTKLGSRSAKEPLNEPGGFEDEVLALGGTKEDLEFLEDADSDSEVDGDAGANGKGRDVGLKNELLKMVQGLGVDKAESRVLEDEVYTDDDTAGDEETDNGGQDENENEDIEEEVVLQENITTKPMTTAWKHTKFDDDEGAAAAATVTEPKRKGKAQLIFQPRSEWHAVELPPVQQSKQVPRAIPLDLSDRIHEHAKGLLEKENSEYAAHHGSASTERKFYSTLMSTGTLSDKISALTLSVQESPLHNMKALESLVALASKRSRDQAVNVLGALKDLFGPGNVLPSDRRLKGFANQPGLAAAFGSGTFHDWTPSSPLPKGLKEIHLVSYAYEDWLKSVFFQVLKILESWCNDEVAYARAKAVDYVSSLLKDKPEQEANLLRLLVNKLGDSDKKIASKTSFNILQLETAHPLMKPTIIAAIESDILFRPNQNLHAKYYATITLNQTVLSAKEETVVRKLLDIYFGLFETQLLKKPVPAQAEAPTTTVNKITVNKKGEIQGGGGPAGKKAQKKLKAQEKSSAVEEDLREKMLSAVLTGVNRAIPYTTVNEAFFDNHMDTLYRITHSSNFNTSIQALMLIQQMNGINQGSQDRFYRVLYESLLDQRSLTSSKQALYLNLLFRALRADLNVNRVKAFVKRLLQIVAMHQPPFVCGVLYLLRELENTFPALATLIDEADEDASDEEEAFHDVLEGDDPAAQPAEDLTANPKAVHSRSKYDPRKRDPNHASASHTPLWELPALIQHYHPSVSLFATRLLGHDPMPPKPDLQQNTLVSFLDRFVYKNPKIGGTAKAKGASIMQPLSGGEDGGVLLSSHSGASSRALPVNSDAFWRQQGEQVDADEVFFHKYFSAVKSKEEKKREKKAKKSKNVGEDGDSGSDEDEEAEIWKALADSRPEIEGDASDVDMDFSDVDELAAAMHEDDSDLSGLDEGDSIGSDDEDLSDLDAGVSDVEMGSDDELTGNLSEDLNDEEAPEAATADYSKKQAREDKKAKRRQLKAMPTFASADDYANMLADGSDEDGR